MGAYYEQLEDMGEDLQEGIFTPPDDKISHLFGLFVNRAGRLSADVPMLKEYSMQLREMHQTQVDIRQNPIMKLLTMVTTIFMPLTLITGWYGMNFTRMPELNAPFGYAVICIISLLIIALEFWLFYIKKWFD